MVTTETSLLRIDRVTSNNPPSCVVVREDRQCRTQVKGCVLEAQFADESELFILIMSDDCPYEERLSIYLLDECLQVLDTATLFRVYKAGVFRESRINDDGTIEFSFFDTTERFVVRVHYRRTIWCWQSGRCLHVQSIPSESPMST